MSENNLSKFSSQKISNGGGDYPYNGKILLAAVVLLSVVVFLVLLLHIYARWLLRCRSAAAPSHLTREPHHHSHHRRRSSVPIIFPYITGGAAVVETRLSVDGVDAKSLALLPVFVYKSPEKLKIELECVVCLAAMEDGETGRFLPRCGHVFHVACVDMWLASHSTCPICRAEVKLEAPPAPSVVGNLEADGVSPSTMAAPVADEGEEVVDVVLDDSRNGGVVDNLVNSAAILIERGKENIDSSSISAAAAVAIAGSSSSSCGPCLKRILSRGFLSQ